MRVNIPILDSYCAPWITGKGMLMDEEVSVLLCGLACAARQPACPPRSAPRADDVTWCSGGFEA